MRRWTIFGIAIMLVFIVLANVAGPQAWAQPDQAQDSTVPTRTPPRPPSETPRPPRPPRPTNTPQSPTPTDTPTRLAATAIATLTPKSATATVTPTSSEPTLTATPTEAGVAPTATGTLSVSTATATAETSASPQPAANTNVEPAQTLAPNDQSAPAGSNVDSTTPASDQSSPTLWVLVIAAALVIFGIVLLFGRRRSKETK